MLLHVHKYRVPPTWLQLLLAGPLSQPEEEEEEEEEEEVASPRSSPITTGLFSSNFSEASTEGGVG